MSSLVKNFKRFLHNQAKYVDFLSASLIISICFIVLLPKVHESFRQPHEHDHEDDHSNDDLTLQLPNGPTIPGQPQPDPIHIPHAHHHHNHSLPIGEVLICAGFFVFYCIGLCLKSQALRTEGRGPMLLAERKVSTVCCPSTRCPSGQREVLDQAGDADVSDPKCRSQEEMLEGAHLFTNQEEDDCVFALNRHHSHHTHSHHHEHSTGHQVPVKKPTNSDYGSIPKNGNKAPEQLVAADNTTKPSTIYVEEIRIRRSIVDSDDDGDDASGPANWPLSIRVTLFGLLLAALLVVFDMKSQGIVETVKVFRAAATGALLYLAFFVVLPKDSAGCNSCTREEV